MSANGGDPRLTDRVAKLLRLALSTGPDGEKLACLDRLGAIAAAHEIDWDQALSGAEPSRDQMQLVYDEGYRRGHSDGAQSARPARDWTPTDGSSAEAGEDVERLRIILEAAAMSAANATLSEWEQQFAQDMVDRFRRYGSKCM